MAYCEDFPCCGHEAGCCPDFDATKKQLNMRCICGAILPLNSRYSICASCMADADDDGDGDGDFGCDRHGNCPDNFDEFEDDFEDNLSAVEADAMALAGAGYGTDEDYDG